MSHNLRLKRVALSGVIPLLLVSCAFAPGMRYEADQPVDSSDPSSVVPVTMITPELIVKEHFASSEVSLRNQLRPLFGQEQAYRIGAGDVLSIIVWDHPELVLPNVTYTIGETSGTLPVTPGLSAQSLPGYVVGKDGYVQFPYIGQAKVGNLTQLEAKNLITAQLAKYLTNPQVTVRVVGFRSKRVFVGGQVTTPGVKSITDVPSSLASILSDSGGIPNSGDRSQVRLTRDGVTYNLNLAAMERAGVSPDAILLHDRDVVNVPPLSDKRVFVLGEVTKPAPVQFRNDGTLTLGDALSDAGGPTQSYSDPSSIFVIRSSEPGVAPTIFQLNAKYAAALSLASQFDLKPNDLVFVDAPNLVRWSRFIALLTGSASGANAIRNVVQP